MRIGIIQASSQADKNEMIFHAVRRYAAGSEAVNFGCRAGDREQYSYVEVSLLAGMLLAGGAVDFVVTGCSSGQGMMLACNSFPGVLCGYIPTRRTRTCSRRSTTETPYRSRWGRSIRGQDGTTWSGRFKSCFRNPSDRDIRKPRRPGNSGIWYC